MDPLLWIDLAAVATSTLSGVFGMADALILMGVCAALLPVTDAMLVHGATQIVANGVRFWLLREHVHWRGVGFYAQGGLVPLALFRAFELTVEPGAVYVLLGGIPLAASLVPARFAPRFDPPDGAALCGVAPAALAALAGAALAGTLVGRRFLEGIGEGSFRVWTRRLVLALSAGFLVQGMRRVAAMGCGR